MVKSYYSNQCNMARLQTTFSCRLTTLNQLINNTNTNTMVICNTGLYSERTFIDNISLPVYCQICAVCLFHFHFHFHFQKTRKCWTGTCTLNFVRFSSIFPTWICLNVNFFTKIKNTKVKNEPKSTCRYKHLVKFTSWLWIVESSEKIFSHSL